MLKKTAKAAKVKAKPRVASVYQSLCEAVCGQTLLSGLSQHTPLLVMPEFQPDGELAIEAVPLSRIDSLELDGGVWVVRMQGDSGNFRNLEGADGLMVESRFFPLLPDAQKGVPCP